MNEDYYGLDSIVYYLYQDEKYIDFQTIMYLINKGKTFTWRLLGDINIPFVEYQNRRLYKVNEVLEDIDIMELIDIDKMGLID